MAASTCAACKSLKPDWAAHRLSTSAEWESVMRIRPLVVSTLALSLLAFAQRRDDKLRKELSDPFGKWLTEDVAYIISDEERRAWKLLATADEREQFIEQFWPRRDPTPDTVENEFKEELYRRIGYANECFASGVP